MTKILKLACIVGLLSLGTGGALLADSSTPATYPDMDCVAPCTVTAGPTLVGCWETDTYATPVYHGYTPTRYQGVYCAENGPCQCDTHGEVPAPTHEKHITKTTYSRRKYGIDASGKWDVFNLSGSAETEDTTVTVEDEVLKLTGWCQWLEDDIVQLHDRNSVDWTQTCDSHSYCFTSHGSGTINLDTFSLADVQYSDPAHLPPFNVACSPYSPDCCTCCPQDCGP